MTKTVQKVGLLLLGNLVALSCFAQLGGSTSFGFLNLPTHARTIALGGQNITSSDQDVNMMTSNPALLVDSVANKLSVSYYPYFADVHSSAISYAHSFKKAGLWGINVQNISYGTFDQTNALGQVTGTFQGSELAVTISHARKIEHFALGANLKLAQASLDTYRASGVFLDVGSVFIHPKKDFKFGLVIRNLGFSLGSFTPSQEFSMPLDIQLGLSFKPQRMPLRFSITANQLQQFDIAFDDPSDDGKVDALGNPLDEKASFTDKLSRHFTLGGEFVFSKNLNLRFGYNFLKRRELAIESRQAMVGFSFGFMIRIKKLEVAYSRNTQFVGGGVNAFTVTLNTKDIFKKKRVIN
ncbi:MAG: type IX secretion system protein PorQ [Flammeovirgaceae bacterium]